MLLGFHFKDALILGELVLFLDHCEVELLGVDIAEADQSITVCLALQYGLASAETHEDVLKSLAVHVASFNLDPSNFHGFEVVGAYDLLKRVVSLCDADDVIVDLGRPVLELAKFICLHVSRLSVLNANLVFSLHAD